MNHLTVPAVTMSRKNRSEKGHRRAASIGTTLDKILRPQQSLEKSSSTHSSFEKGFDRDKGTKTLSETKLKEVVPVLALESRKRENSPLNLPPRPASMSPTLGLVSLKGLISRLCILVHCSARLDFLALQVSDFSDHPRYR
jgi:hypothetical protein